MRQVYRIAGTHEPIDEPIPIIGGLDGNALQRGSKRFQCGEDQGQLIREPFLVEHPILVIEHHDDAVGGMQIDSRITPHRSLLGLGGCEPPRHARRSLYTPDQEPSR